MRNLKITDQTVKMFGLAVRGLRFLRLPRHTPRELIDLKAMSTADRKKRSRNRAASKVARHARRVTRHGR